MPGVPRDDSRPGHTGREVFEILAREHADMLVAYLRSLVGSTHAVDDLFQETMLTAWRRLGDYDRARPFAPWLRGIATRLVLQHRRQRGRSVLSCDPEVIEALDRRFEALGQLSGDSFRERVDRLVTCLSRLPDTLREIVELVYGRGLLIRQVAVALDAGEEALKKRVQRARQLLAECLQSLEVES